MGRNKTRMNKQWTDSDRQALASDLAKSLWGERTLVCKKHGCKSIGHAIGVLGIKSVKELLPPNDFLLRFGLIFHHTKRTLSTLASLRNENGRTIVLTEEEAHIIQTDTIGYLKANSDAVKYLIGNPTKEEN